MGKNNKDCYDLQIIQMDGDFYGFILPYWDHWKKIPSHICSKRCFFQRKSFGKNTIGPFTHFELLTATKHGEVNGLVVLRDDNGGMTQISQMTKKVAYLCPMLIPLDANGFFDRSIQGDMLNGTIVTGGSFFINGQILSLSKPRRLKDEDSFAIGDTTGNTDHDIQWVWINGCLVCIDEFVSCHTDYPIKHRLLGGDLT